MEDKLEINKVIGNNLTILRKNSKLTQLELAEKFNYSDKSISKWESGESLPSVEVLCQICEFYHTDLNSLTNPNFSIQKNVKKEEKQKVSPTKVIINLLSVSAVWLLVTIFFVSIKITLKVNYWKIFLWAIPLSFVVFIIFNGIWFKDRSLFTWISMLIWSTLACFHIQLIDYNLWIIYILGIPLQISVILWAALVSTPHHKNKKLKKEKLKKEKIDKNDNNIEKNEQI